MSLQIHLPPASQPHLQAHLPVAKPQPIAKIRILLDRHIGWIAITVSLWIMWYRGWV